jgi:hypothetical protein
MLAVIRLVDVTDDHSSVYAGMRKSTFTQVNTYMRNDVSRIDPKKNQVTLLQIALFHYFNRFEYVVRAS